jgi:transposase
LAKPANEVITDFNGEIPLSSDGQAQNSGPSASTCEPYRDAIEWGLSRGRTAMAIWQDLVSTGYEGGYQTVQRFISKAPRVQRPEPSGIIVTAAGRSTGRLRYRTDGTQSGDGQVSTDTVVVMTLGCSRKSVRLLTFRSSRIWASCMKAFRRLGGSPRIVVLDNLRRRSESIDPVNPYRDMWRTRRGGHARRVRDPDHGESRNRVGHARNA